MPVKNLLAFLLLALVELRSKPPISLLIVFGLGSLLFGMAGNFISALVLDTERTVERAPLFGVIILILLLAAIAGVWRYTRRTHLTLQASENSQVPLAAYLVSTLSPLEELRSGGSNLDNIRRLIVYHRETLQEIYLVCVLRMEEGHLIAANPEYPETEGVIAAYKQLEAWVNETLDVVPIIRLVSVLDPNSAQASFDAITLVLHQMQERQVPQSNIILDVTAGTKALSIGIAVAALAHGCQISYQATKRDKEGQPIYSSRKYDTSMVTLEVEPKVARY